MAPLVAGLSADVPFGHHKVGVRRHSRFPSGPAGIYILPHTFLKPATGGMFVAELILPLPILTPANWRKLRLVACVGLTFLQVTIGATGNYGFFSLLSILLCLTLIDDQTWRLATPSR